MGISQATALTLENANLQIFQIAEDIFDPTNRRPAVFDSFTEIGTVGGELTIEHQVLEALAPIRKWDGERQYRNVLLAVVRGLKETWEKTHGIDRKQSQTLTGQMLVARLQKWLGSPEIDFDKMVHSVAFLGGTGPTGFDGVPLWSASHPRGRDGAVQSNTSATAWSVAQHNAVMMLGASITDVYGENLGIDYDTIVVGPRLAPSVREFLKPERVQTYNASGAEATASVVAVTTGPSAKNLTIYEGNGMRLIVNPRFSIGSAMENKYLYLDSKCGAKPFHFYRGESNLASLTAPELPNVFNNDQYIWGITHDVVMMAGAWHGAFYGGA
jgi:hypothetical protein